MSNDSNGVRISCTLNLIISVSAFICAYFRNPFCFKDGVGIVGVIATIISIPVAILIGWNIYTLIDLKELSKKTKDMEENFSKTLDSKITELNNNIKADMAGVSIVLFGVSMNVDKDLQNKIINACETYSKIKGCGDISSLLSFRIMLSLLSCKQLSDSEIENITSGLDKDLIMNISYDIESHKSEDIEKAINNMEKILAEKIK